jgi:ribosomal protein L40E
MFCRNCGKELPPTAEFCTSCGVRVLRGEKYCKVCGAETRPGAEVCVKCGAGLACATEGKSWLVTLLLAVFVGYFGVDRFYLGKVGTGILKLITMGGFGLWWLIDIILIATDNTKDAMGRPLVKTGMI